MTKRSWSCQACGRSEQYEDPDPSPDLGKYRWVRCERCGRETEQEYAVVGEGWQPTGRIKGRVSLP
jgi:DNA-directed RNA polymerase subunit RPC12/RpoP